MYMLHIFTSNRITNHHIFCMKKTLIAVKNSPGDKGRMRSYSTVFGGKSETPRNEKGLTAADVAFAGGDSALKKHVKRYDYSSTQ